MVALVDLHEACFRTWTLKADKKVPHMHQLLNVLEVRFDVLCTERMHMCIVHVCCSLLFFAKHSRS